MCVQGIAMRVRKRGKNEFGAKDAAEDAVIPGILEGISFFCMCVFDIKSGRDFFFFFP